MRLYTYFRSSAAYRVRIALNLKGLDYTAVPVHLLRDGGEQHGQQFAEFNPARLVPVLQDAGATLTQSLAIIEYLEQTHPLPPLLPASAVGRAPCARAGAEHRLRYPPAQQSACHALSQVRVPAR